MTIGRPTDSRPVLALRRSSLDHADYDPAGIANLAGL
jgi:hypothetical protein